MILSKKAIEAISNLPARRKLAEALNTSDEMIRRMIKANESNSNLTKTIAVNLIKKHYGISINDILIG